MPAEGHTLLNLGCGSNIHPAFVNVDINPGPGVIAHDLRRGIPFPDESFELVYHSTMLSTMRPAEALAFTRECRRVLKAGGVLRVVTEDLEQMCRVYLEKLEGAMKGDLQSAADYEWMMLELYDQATRERDGGGMLDYLLREPLLNEAFIYSRVGVQGRRMVAGARARARARQAQHPAKSHPLSNVKTRIRQLVLETILGQDGVQAYRLGKFKLTSGQVSYRMYDRYSLSQLFMRAGFSHVSLKTPRESAYPNWDAVTLDVAEGAAARPHSLIMEGIRAS